MTRYLQKLNFGVDGEGWWVGWEIEGLDGPVDGLVLADSMTEGEIRELGVSSFHPVNRSVLERIERRNVPRVRLEPAIRGRIGLTEVAIVDVSARGLGVAHDRPFRPGKVVHVELSQNDRWHSVQCEILRCEFARGLDTDGHPRYYSSLRLRPETPADRNTLSSIVRSVMSHRENQGEALAHY